MARTDHAAGETRPAGAHFRAAALTTGANRNGCSTRGDQSPDERKVSDPAASSRFCADPRSWRGREIARRQGLSARVRPPLQAGGRAATHRLDCLESVLLVTATGYAASIGFAVDPENRPVGNGPQLFPIFPNANKDDDRRRDALSLYNYKTVVFLLHVDQ